MNQKLLSGFAATLLISTLGLAPSGYANQSESADDNPEVHNQGVSTRQVATSILNPPTGQSTAPADLAPTPAVDTDTMRDLQTLEEKLPTPPIPTEGVPTETDPVPTSSDLASPQPSGAPSVEVVKVGEYQTHEALRQTALSAENTVATIQPHSLRGRQAATLYVRNIPVLTFLGSSSAQTESNPVPIDGANSANSDGAEVKIASVQSTGSSTSLPQSEAEPAASPRSNSVHPEQSNDPVWRATTTAARLNQLHRDNVSASDIKIVWDKDRQRYVISANDTEIVTVDDNTVLPDTVENASNDVLQATNRIRRQMGNASPLSNIEGDPNAVGRISLGSIRLSVSGLASWYGPGFDGNYSASGEVFNQEAMTAAHPSLPFGTQVRVTNLDNGQSVVVRINDRGPYAHGRVIDLSTGAARIIGLVSAGVAPVSLEVLGAAQAVVD